MGLWDKEIWRNKRHSPKKELVCLYDYNECVATLKPNSNIYEGQILDQWELPHYMEIKSQNQLEEFLMELKR